MTKHDDAYWDARLREIAEHAAGVVYEKLQDDLERASEASKFITSQLKASPTRQEFDDLDADVKLNRLIGVELNKDIGRHSAMIAYLDTRIGQLEHA